MNRTPAGGSATIRCPGCGTAMRALALQRKPHGEVEVDLCPACRGLWFDTFESLQLTPAATLALLRAAAALDGPAERPPTTAPACPRCRKRLAETRDLQRTTRFSYWRCPGGHGRFTPLVQFMREKDYVRPLAPAEIERVRSHIGTVRCSGCGAPVDLGRQPACGYCGAPVEVINPQAVREAIARTERVETTIGAPSAAAIDGWLQDQLPRRDPPNGAGADLIVGGLRALFATLAAR